MLACPPVTLTSQAEDSVYLLCRCEHRHTLPHSLAHWSLVGSRDTVPGARVFSAPSHLELLLFLVPCLTLTAQALRPGGQNTQQDTHLFYNLQ